MSLKSGMKSWIGASVVALTVVGSAQAAEVYNKNGVLLNLNGEIQAFGAAINEDYTAKDRDEVTWTEGLVKLGLSTEIDITKGWKLFGAVTGIANGTGGEGDPINFGVGGDGDVGLFEAYGGIKFESGEGGPSVKLSGGRQVVKIADGFLIGADVPTLGSGQGDRFDEGGAYYLNARKTFGNTAVLNVETGTPIRFDAFWLESAKDWQGNVQVAGGNVEYVSEKWGKLGFMYTNIVEVDPIVPFLTARQEGTDMYTVHGSTGLGIKDFELAGNYTRQLNDDGDAGFDTDAVGWYASAKYKFSNVKWTPEIMYRYSFFSGDDASTADNEAFDPLFFGSLSWGTWFQGEIAANYSGPFSTNNDVHQIKATINPMENLTLGAIYNRFTVDEPTTQSDYYGTELNLYAEITINKNLYISPPVRRVLAR